MNGVLLMYFLFKMNFYFIYIDLKMTVNGVSTSFLMKNALQWYIPAKTHAINGAKKIKNVIKIMNNEINKIIQRAILKNRINNKNKLNILIVHWFLYKVKQIYY